MNNVEVFLSPYTCPEINDLENHERERGEIDDRHKPLEVTPLGAMRKVDKKA